MDLDDLLFRYFGARELANVPQSALTAGIERMQVDFGLETDLAWRFALWCLLHLLKAAPDFDVAFENEADREAARNFMDQMVAECDEGCRAQTRVDRPRRSIAQLLSLRPVPLAMRLGRRSCDGPIHACSV